MVELNLLEKVKAMNNITGNYQDTIIQCYIDDVKQYLVDGGVSQEIVDAPTSAGVIARGVGDLFYGDKLSNYFKERAIQLSFKKSSNVPIDPSVPTPQQTEVVPISETEIIEIYKEVEAR